MSTKVKIVVTFCLSILILLMIGVFAYKNINDYKDASDWVHHTQKVISQAERILLDIQDIETEQRGYVITGEDRYLEYYNRGLKNIETDYDFQKQLVGDNISQTILLDTIHVLLDQRIAFSKKAVSIRNENGFEPAKSFVSTGRGEDLMNRIRTLTAKFIKQEEQFLSERLSVANKNFRYATTVLITSIALTVIIVAIALFFFIQDYNVRLKAEKKVVESEMRIKKMLDSLPIGVFVMAADGTPFYSNVRSQQILGKGIVPDAKIHELTEVYHAFEAGTENIYPTNKQPILKALKGEKTVGAEDMEILKNGIRFPLRISATYITDSDNNIEYGISIFEDITDIKENEKKLLEAKKLAEESVILKETFLANMSHEIRTPMNAIIGFTDLLLKKNQLDEQAKDFVRTIKTSGETLLRIINDILDVSKMDSGMMTFEEYPISIKEIFGSLNVLLAQKANEKNLSLNFECENNIPGTVLGDPTRLTQIIINIVGNAIKFTKKGGVHVMAKIVAENADSYNIEFSIKDTGIGIPEDKLQFIFERFRQAESHTTRNYGGTGLGLSIAKQLIDLQGGNLSIKSMVEVGSVFTFTLPFKKTDIVFNRSSKITESFDESSINKMKILLVEDNPINIKFVQSLFSQYNFMADVAENGKIGIEKIKNQSYDLILMDIEMPEMNGYETTLHIRNVLKSNVPIIAMTAHAMSGEREKCLQLGMNDYISKPIDANILFEKMVGAKKVIASEEDYKQASSEKIINLSFLSKSVMGNNALIVSIIDVFLEQIVVDMAELKDAVSQENYMLVKKISHRMKSTVSVMGADSLTQILEKMELYGKNAEHMPEIKKMATVLSNLCNKAIEETVLEKKNLI